MAKFVFKMENILKIKKQLENQERMNLGQAMAKLNEEEEKLKLLIEKRSAYEDKAKELVTGSLDFRAIAANRDSIAVMKSLIRTQMIEVSVQQKNVELARNRLKNAITETKTYEKLKEQAFEDFKREVVFEENKINDETVSYRYNSSLVD